MKEGYLGYNQPFIYLTHSGAFVMENCILTNNNTKYTYNGACVYAELFIIGKALFRNNIFAYNHAKRNGGAVFIWECNDIQFFNNTIVYNIADDSGGAFTIWICASCEIENNIIAYNSSELGGGIYIDADNYPLTINYNDFWQNDGGDLAGDIYNIGNFNIFLDPLFVQGPLGEYYLSHIEAGQNANSPCIDKGNPYRWYDGSTRTDGVPDQFPIDIGYHYPLLDLTPTFPPHPTFTPTPTPTFTPSPFPTPIPFYTSTPTVTPLITSTPTPTPTPILGIKLSIPQNIFHPGDTFYLSAFIFNFSNIIFRNVNIFVFLDIGTGEYWFAPSWSHFPPDFDYYHTDLIPGSDDFYVIEPITIPDNIDSFYNLIFWAAITDYKITTIIGSFDSVSFSIINF